MRLTILPVLCAALALTGCRATVPVASLATPTPVRAPAPPIADRAPAPAPRPVAAVSRPRALTEEELFAGKSLSDLNEERPLGDSFFDYDQITLRDNGRAALQRDAQWLRRWTRVVVTVQGQCDERGSAEYNLTLGARRAAAVKDYLVSLGVPESRITTVSLGKESPVCTEDSEACWSRNRRGHFLITAK